MPGPIDNDIFSFTCLLWVNWLREIKLVKQVLSRETKTDKEENIR